MKGVLEAKVPCTILGCDHVFVLHVTCSPPRGLDYVVLALDPESTHEVNLHLETHQRSNRYYVERG